MPTSSAETAIPVESRPASSPSPPPRGPTSRGADQLAGRGGGKLEPDADATVRGPLVGDREAIGSLRRPVEAGARPPPRRDRECVGSRDRDMARGPGEGGPVRRVLGNDL